MYHVGFDPGFGNAKAVLAGAEERTAVVPSVVGVGETDLGLLSIGDLGRRRRRSIPDRVSYAGTTYLVGQNVARYTRPVQRMDFLRLSDGPELRALFYDTLFRLLGEGSHRAALVIGLPVEVMADRDQAGQTLRALRSWMVGEHRFEVDGSGITLDVEDVRAMAQPAGAFFAWGLGTGGKWARDKSHFHASVAVCDVGFNTLDLFAIQGGEIVGRFTGGDTAGMRRAAELLVSTVKAHHQVELSLHEADELLRKRHPRLFISEGEVDLRSLAQQALDTAAAGVVTFVEQRWGNGKQFAHLLFVGGGGRMLQKGLLRQYPHGVVLPDPVTANATGLARYAAMVWGG